MRWDAEVERVLREWMAAGRCDDVAAIATIFSDQPSLFVIDERAFVIELVGWARSCGEAVSQRIEAALFASMSTGVRVRSRGEGNPIDLRLRDGGREVVAGLRAAGSGSSRAADFFSAVQARAEADLNSEVQRAEELHQVSEMEDWDYD
jgi:hypothetical protein